MTITRRRFLTRAAITSVGVTAAALVGLPEVADASNPQPGDTSLHFTKAEDDALVAAARLADPVITDLAVGRKLARKNLVYLDGGVYRFHDHGLALAICKRDAFDMLGVDL